jgi:hypothetical protein
VLAEFLEMRTMPPFSEGCRPMAYVTVLSVEVRLVFGIIMGMYLVIDVTGIL